MQISDTLTITDCPTCGVVYAVPDGLIIQAKRHRKTRDLYCPNGHNWHYLGETPEQKAKRLEEELARERAEHDQAMAHQRAQTTRARNERDRLKKRAAAGVCPCCNRTFQQLARHMKSKHPDYVKENKP